MPSEEDIKAQQELLFACRRTLFVFLKQRAQITAIFVPPAIATGIEDARDQIRRIKHNLRDMAVPIDDQHNDDEAPLPQPQSISKVHFESAGSAKSGTVGWYIGAFVLFVALGAVSLVIFLDTRHFSPPTDSSATLQTPFLPSAASIALLVTPAADSSAKVQTPVPLSATTIPPSVIPAANSSAVVQIIVPPSATTIPPSATIIPPSATIIPPLATTIPPSAALTSTPTIIPEPIRIEAEQGRTIANANPLVAAIRASEPEGLRRDGFAIGMGAWQGDTLDGPGKQALARSLAPEEQIGFADAATFSFQWNNNADFAAKGAAIAAKDPEVATARAQAHGTPPDGLSAGLYWLGFDIATGIFGDPKLGAEGSTIPGPVSKKVRATLGSDGQQGFDDSLAFNAVRR